MACFKIIATGVIIVAIFEVTFLTSLKRDIPQRINGIDKLSTDITEKYFYHLKCLVVVGEKFTEKESFRFELFNLPNLIPKFNFVLSQETKNLCYTPLIYDFLEMIFEHGCTG